MTSTPAYYVLLLRCTPRFEFPGYVLPLFTDEVPIDLSHGPLQIITSSILNRHSEKEPNTYSQQRVPNGVETNSPSIYYSYIAQDCQKHGDLRWLSMDWIPSKHGEEKDMCMAHYSPDPFTDLHQLVKTVPPLSKLIICWQILNFNAQHGRDFSSQLYALFLYSSRLLRSSFFIFPPNIDETHTFEDFSQDICKLLATELGMTHINPSLKMQAMYTWRGPILCSAARSSFSTMLPSISMDSVLTTTSQVLISIEENQFWFLNILGFVPVCILDLASIPLVSYQNIIYHAVIDPFYEQDMRKLVREGHCLVLRSILIPNPIPANLPFWNSHSSNWTFEKKELCTFGDWFVLGACQQQRQYWMRSLEHASTSSFLSNLSQLALSNITVLNSLNSPSSFSSFSHQDFWSIQRGSLRSLLSRHAAGTTHHQPSTSSSKSNNHGLCPVDMFIDSDFEENGDANEDVISMDSDFEDSHSELPEDVLTEIMTSGDQHTSTTTPKHSQVFNLIENEEHLLEEEFKTCLKIASTLWGGSAERAVSEPSSAMDIDTDLVTSDMSVSYPRIFDNARPKSSIQLRATLTNRARSGTHDISSSLASSTDSLDRASPRKTPPMQLPSLRTHQSASGRRRSLTTSTPAPIPTAVASQLLSRLSPTNKSESNRI